MSLCLHVKHNYIATLKPYRTVMERNTIPVINLTEQDINNALPKVSVGLEKYLKIQKRLSEQSEISLIDDSDFQKKFNGFYRIRQKPASWYKAFYTLFDESRNAPVDYHTVLKSLHKLTGRYEASFASKLLASIDTQMPVIDSIVLQNLNLKLPYPYETNRLEAICLIHERLKDCYLNYLQTERGKYLVDIFRSIYPNVNISEVKILDLVLWQSRN